MQKQLKLLLMCGLLLLIIGCQPATAVDPVSNTLPATEALPEGNAQSNTPTIMPTVAVDEPTVDVPTVEAVVDVPTVEVVVDVPTVEAVVDVPTTEVLAESTPAPPTGDEQDPARIAEMVRDTQPPILPRQADCVADLPLEIYDDFNARYAVWVANVVQSGDLTPLHDNRLIVLEPGHGPTLVSYPRSYCSQGASNGNGMLFVIVNADGTHQLLDAISGFPQQTPLPYSWIGDRFVLLVSLNEPYPPNEVAVEVWQIMLTDAGWQLQTHPLPDTPHFSDIRGASGELQIMQHTHGILGRVILDDATPPCEFQPDSPFAAGGVWEDQRAFMFLEGQYQLWESHRVYSTIAPGGERLDNWTSYCASEATDTPEVVAADPTPDPLMPVPPAFSVDHPGTGAQIPIAQPFTVSGQLISPPLEETTITVYFMVDGGTHPNFDSVTVDSLTGEWAIETDLHPQYVGEAELVIEANSGPETERDSGGSVTIPVTLVYDETDSLAYVNLTSPLELSVVAQSGDTLVITGSAHNPIDGKVWLRGLEEGVNEPLFFEEITVGENGMWQMTLPISPEWTGKTWLTEACTGPDGAPDVAWCSTVFLTVE